MKGWARLAILASLWLLGCELSPGQDLPSASSQDGAGDKGPFPSIPTPDLPGGDGDLTNSPPEERDPDCSWGGATASGDVSDLGGAGGACPSDSHHR